MPEYPKISIVTVCLNHGTYLEDTIRSVVNQRYPNLEYIIIDGGSRDCSIEIIQKYEKDIAYWVSEPDNGPADALNKGFAKSSGEIMAWINSDDRYHHKSLYSIAKLFGSNPGVSWIMGFPTWYNTEGLSFFEMPRTGKMKRYAIQNSHLYQKWARWSKYRYYNWDSLAIQQESTFWKRGLWEKAGGTLDSNFGYAFDMELWARFFRYDKLYSSNAMVAGFRLIKEGQRSTDNAEKYLGEAKQIVHRELDRLGAYSVLQNHLRFALAALVKPLYYFDVPIFREVYAKLLAIPDVVLLTSQ